MVRKTKELKAQAFTPDDVERRHQIWDAVIGCITEGGIEGATIRKVADSVGGSTGMITYYFQSKKELITESITSLTERSIGAVNESVGEQYTPQRLNAVADLYLVHPGGDVAPITFWLWVWAEATRDPDLLKVTQENFMKTREILARCAEAGIESGQIRPDLDPYLVADALTSIIMGLRLRMQLLPEVVSAERALEIAQFLINAFAPYGAPDKKP
ncbi:MAG TPA: TetR family transcriptional regulator C-terminal domain-containing protein [Dehalococcoidia bacterium]|nr:TetR family transcriptional regulator C-terminal domain-containing protein [Dehalococcoidia bacterium]